MLISFPEDRDRETGERSEGVTKDSRYFTDSKGSQAIHIRPSKGRGQN